MIEKDSKIGYNQGFDQNILERSENDYVKN